MEMKGVIPMDVLKEWGSISDEYIAKTFKSLHKDERKVIIVKTQKKYMVGGNRWMLADGIEYGEPTIILIVDFPQQIEIGDHFLAELDMFQKEIAEIAESFCNHQ